MSTSIEQEKKEVVEDKASDPAAPTVSPKVESEQVPPAHTAKPLYRRRGVLVVAAVVVLLGLVFGVRYWLYARSHESTDDAFIEGHVIQISPKVSGYVARVHVDDNQQVKAGDLLVEIDARDYEVRVQQAKAALDAARAKENEARTNVDLTRATTTANVQQARATVRQAQTGVASSRAGAGSSASKANEAGSSVSAAEASLAQAQAQVTAAEAEAVRARADVQRYQALLAKDEISRQQVDSAVAASRTADAELEVARHRVAAAVAQVNATRSSHAAATDTARQGVAEIAGAQAGVAEAVGRLAQANTAPQQVAVSQAQAATAKANTEQLAAQVAQAELELSYTKIYASDDGRVTRKSVEEGALVQIGQPLLALVPGNVWVIANFKENQLGRIVPGQQVEIRVDTYRDKVFKGHVDSIQAGTGARFSLLPPENATGNYVKVVQRIPVKIVFDEPPDPRHMLAPGMSVVPEVAIR